MIVRSMDVPTTPTNVIQMAGISQKTWTGLFFQAPSANAETIFFGDPSIQTFELRPERSAFFPIAQAETLHFVATSPGNKVTVAFL